MNNKPLPISPDALLQASILAERGDREGIAILRHLGMREVSWLTTDDQGRNHMHIVIIAPEREGGAQ